jgi:hypothetical protein
MYSLYRLKLVADIVTLICQSQAGINVIHRKCRLAMDENDRQIMGSGKYLGQTIAFISSLRLHPILSNGS